MLHYIAREWRMLPCWVLGYEAIQQHSKCTWRNWRTLPTQSLFWGIQLQIFGRVGGWKPKTSYSLSTSQYHATSIYFHLLSNDWPWLAIACHSNTIDIWMFIWGQTTSSSVQCWRSSELCLAGEELRLFDWSWSLDFQQNSSELFRTLWLKNSDLFKINP